MVPIVLATFLGFFCPLVSGHAAMFTPAMWGFNVTDKTFPYDNRPVSPLMNMPFDQWWFHGHLDYPPNEGDTFDLPAGQNVTSEIGCNKGATSFFASSEGGDIQSGNDVCPGSPMAEYHTAGFDDLRGCALAIAYKANVSEVQPEDFTIFSVNHTCVWTRHTDFAVPTRMPPCPEGGCICSWFWIHSEDSGGEQNYMNGFRCNVINSTSNVALAQPQVPRRCGADRQAGRPSPTPANCTYGAKQPFYWFQTERNNMFEGTYSPPRYSSMYNFLDGAQDDIFQDSYEFPLPSPSPNQTVLPRRLDGLPVRIPDADLLPSNNVTGSVGSSSQTASVASTSSTMTSPSTSSAITSSIITSSIITSAGLSSAPDRTGSPTTVISTLFVTVTATISPTESSFTSAAPPTTTASTSLSSVRALESTIFLNPAASAAAAIRQGVANGSGTPSNTTTFSGTFAVDADVSDISETVNASPGNSSVRDNTNSSICKRGSIVPFNTPASSSGGSRRRSLANRLGMGVYERKHRMHRRGLEGLWRIW